MNYRMTVKMMGIPEPESYEFSAAHPIDLIFKLLLRITSESNRQPFDAWSRWPVIDSIHFDRVDESPKSR